MANSNKGVIYYKLDPEYHYEGDSTKDCGLTGGEIDGNFHFLRGYDISDFKLSENREELLITRLNGETLKVNLKDNLKGFDFQYDDVNGILKIETPMGEKFDLEGFLTEVTPQIYCDITIDGDGTVNNPIRLSSFARTGTYRPAKRIIDLTNEEGGDSLPSQNVGMRERYVTKEKVSKYGLLYPLHGVEAIQARLKEIGSEWRVPTKEDWAQLLNIVEEHPEYQTHDSDLSNVDLGVNAGAFLKSVDNWKGVYRKLLNGEVVVEGERYSLDKETGMYVPDENGEYIKIVYSDDRYGFSIHPSGFGDRRGRNSVGGYGEWAAFWTSSESAANDDMYVKIFSHCKRTVEQNTWGRGYYLSLRLVKDYTGSNREEIEVIDGNSVRTIYIPPYTNEDKRKYGRGLVWTSENIGFSDEIYDGIKSSEWIENDSESFTYRYYINEWDGTKWIKNEMSEGEAIVIIEHEGRERHQWTIIDGELVDTLGEFHDEFLETKDELDNTIEKLTERVRILEEALNVLINITLPSNLKDLRNSIISDEVFKGTHEEISVKVEQGKSVTYSFADDAIFSAYTPTKNNDEE